MDVAHERRKLERFFIELPAKIEVVSMSHRELPLTLFTKDISSNGAYFWTKEGLPVGTEVKVDLVLSLDKLKKFLNDREKVTVNVTGTVLRAEPQGMAVEFSEDYRFHQVKKQERSRH